MLKREDWLPLARKLDWNFSYVDEKEVFPEIMSGGPWLPHSDWQDWDEPFKTTFSEYVRGQAEKEVSVNAVAETLGHLEYWQDLPPSWIQGLKLHGAVLPLAEFAAVIGNLRGARFGRDSAWRQMHLLGALDELRHTQIPLKLMHELVKWDCQFDWTHKFYHSNNWVAIAARHFFDELLLGTNVIEYAVATNFLFETGFTNLQFMALSSLAHQTKDHMFEKMITSIQTDEARHAQIGSSVMSILMEHDPDHVQYLLDKWFWRSWNLFSIVTGFSMDYFTPLKHRTHSFKEFMQEWILDQFLLSLEQFGLKRPWYWEQFLEAMDWYHHMVYVSAYTYRSTVWFDMVVPGPAERSWLQQKYPSSWSGINPLWEMVDRRWEESDPGNNWAVHGTSIIGFCSLCQLVLCGGTPHKNTANVLGLGEKKYIFCSEPCRWIFEQETEKYGSHLHLVDRVLAGEAPGNLLEMLSHYFGLSRREWGKDVYGGIYPWIKREKKRNKENGD